jgi:hypothetical protein
MRQSAPSHAIRITRDIRSKPLALTNRDGSLLMPSHGLRRAPPGKVRARVTRYRHARPLSRIGTMNAHSTVVVLDTNVWRSELLLTSPLGEALVFALVQDQGTIGLPEIVELELKKHVVRAGMEASNQIQANLDFIQRIQTGRSRPESDLMFALGLSFARYPEEAEVARWIDRRLDALPFDLRRVPFTEGHARRALLRVIDETAPNGPKNQQFKDSAIWEAILEIADKNPVVFVTRDKGFYANRTPSSGLDPALLADAKRSRQGITVVTTLAACLREMGKSAVVPSFEALSEILGGALESAARRAAGRRELRAATQPEFDIEHFPTDDWSGRAVSFRASYTLDSDEGTTGTLSIQGEAATDVLGSRITNLVAHDIRLHIRALDGEEFLYGDPSAIDEVNARSATTVIPRDEEHLSTAAGATGSEEETEAE